jgi:putative redox protein
MGERLAYGHGSGDYPGMRLPTPRTADRIDTEDGLSYALWLPREGAPGDGEVRAGVVILHGASSAKESHYDYARACAAAGYAAIAFDMRGHGASQGELDGQAFEDIATIARLLPEAPLALRGSSMGGWFAIAAARAVGADAIVAICPASSELLIAGLRSGRFEFAADQPGLEALLEAHDLERSVAELEIPLLIMHAEGDESVPVEHSTQLYAAARMPLKRLIAVPGGHHSSVQHDPELQGESLRFLAKAFSGRS